MNKEDIVSRIPQVRTQIIRERMVAYDQQRAIASPEDAARFASLYIGGDAGIETIDREHLVVLLLSTKNKLQAVHTVSIGTLNASFAAPREVFRTAILGSAASIVVAHNHPSGDPSPSPEDLAITNRLIEAGKILGIELLDHVVVAADERYVSLRERGFINNA